MGEVAITGNLRRLRLALGVSQEELAFRAKLDRTYVSSVERGHRNISVENIYRLASALQCDPRELWLLNVPLRRRARGFKAPSHARASFQIGVVKAKVNSYRSPPASCALRREDSLGEEPG